MTLQEVGKISTINIFHIGDVYVFKHYFEGEDVFDEFRDYYDSFEYRFEVNDDEVEDVVEKLEDNGFDTNIVEGDEIPDYTVVINRYEKHVDLLKKSVDVVEVRDEKGARVEGQGRQGGGPGPGEGAGRGVEEAALGHACDNRYSYSSVKETLTAKYFASIANIQSRSQPSRLES
ncbi:hypothetical protein AKJ41_05240 [candidate division MSBL1 archaeon SCGC-AAA259O05]|uniref:Uncharacterized protein n=1 Tax=candidate division MSBL1 archaeon SCGC-AAA259O05 TaxID=1698271 RepID=A0A133UZE6_9EURY|nr:hypothetical protein AKJ41_05240 [candidate division MSBL1 archaeon SCGC-AAA259O05]